MGVLTLLVGMALAQSPRMRTPPAQAAPVAPAKKGLTAVIEPYGGSKDAYKISNGTIEVVVVPKIGRIMRYGFVGGPNILWENAALKGKAPDLRGTEYANFGGDKLWVAPQSMWGWPPPGELDAGPYVGTPIPNGLKLVGPKSPRFGVHMEREITLGAKGAEVRILNRMVNEAPFTVRRSIWEDAQVDSPDRVTVGLRTSKAWPKGYHEYQDADSSKPFVEVKDGLLIMKIDPDRAAKFGAASSNGTLTAQRGELTFTMSAKYEGRGVYPDEGSAQQIYLNKGPDRYAELELVSPVVSLKSQENREMVVRWNLTGGTPLTAPAAPNAPNAHIVGNRR